MVSRKVDWKYLVLAVIATAIVFGTAFSLGLTLKDYKTAQLRKDIKQIEISQASQSLSLRLAEEIELDECRPEKEWKEDSIPKLENLRKKVAAYESSSKFRGEDYRTLKQRYMNLLIRNLVEAKTLEKRCDYNLTEVIYLYTKNDCGRCEDQGTVLTYFDKKNPDVIVYPLDTDFDMEHINFLERSYNITSYPALVVEGEVYRGYQSKEQVSDILGGNASKSSEE